MMSPLGMIDSRTKTGSTTPNAAILFSTSPLSSQTLFTLQQAIASVTLPGINLWIAPHGLVAECTVMGTSTLTSLGQLRSSLEAAGRISPIESRPEIVRILDQELYRHCGHNTSLVELAQAPCTVFCDDPDQAEAIAAVLGGSIRQPSACDPLAVLERDPMSHYSPRRSWFRSNAITSTSVMWSMPLPLASSTEDALTRSVACWILGGHPESRLCRALRTGQGLAYNPATSLRFVGGTQWFFFMATTRIDNGQALITRVDAAFEHEHTNSVTEREIRLALKFMGAHSRKFARSTRYSAQLDLICANGQDPYALSRAVAERTISPPSVAAVTAAIRAMTDLNQLTLVAVSPENPPTQLQFSEA